MSRSVGVNTLSDDYCKAHTPQTSPFQYLFQQTNYQQYDNAFTSRIIYGPSYGYQYGYGSYYDKGSSTQNRIYAAFKILKHHHVNRS